MVAGRKSIFMISGITAILSFGLMMIYFIVFGDICKSMMQQIFFEEDSKSFLCTRTCYIMILGGALFPMIIKKELKELKIASVILFLGISSFILIFTFQLLFEGNTENKDRDYSDYFTISHDLGVIKGLAIIIIAI